MMFMSVVFPEPDFPTSTVSLFFFDRHVHAPEGVKILFALHGKRAGYVLYVQHVSPPPA